ncbi:unnamed protein product [Rhizophagus irregularis]|nr:unnamed protein product [Rhizophagus irregularis]
MLSNKEAMIQHTLILHHLRSLFNLTDMINIYTDGLLTTQFNANSNTFTKHMGTGWVILNDKEDVILECSSSITEWPLSRTRSHPISYTYPTNKTEKLKLTKVKGHSEIKGNEEADRVVKNDTERLTCITINDSQQKDLKYDIYWDGRVDRHIRKFIDNIYESVLEVAWFFNRAHRTIFQDTTCVIEEKVTWALLKKNTGLNCTISTINDRFIKHLKLTNNLLPTLEIIKERRYDLYGDVKCRMCLEENENDDHIIYCQQLRDKWLMVANNTMHKCDQMLKDLLSQEKDTQLLLL